MVPTGLRYHLREIRRQGASLLPGLSEGSRNMLSGFFIHSSVPVSPLSVSLLVAGLFVCLPVCIGVFQVLSLRAHLAYLCVFVPWLTPCTVHLFPSFVVPQRFPAGVSVTQFSACT